MHLFNITGYNLLFSLIIKKSDKELVSSLDNKLYKIEDLLEIKIPVYLPYVANQQNYERIDGELEFNGVYYNYVKRKISRDTLYLLCVYNEAKTRLDNARLSYGQQVNDFPSDNSSHTAVIKKNWAGNEYNQHFLSFFFDRPVTMIDKSIQPFETDIITIFIKGNFHPPRHLS